MNKKILTFIFVGIFCISLVLANEIMLQDNETENLADIYYFSGSIPNYLFGSQIKWNISSLPSGSIIEDASLCLYIFDDTGTPNNDIKVWRINNQSWDESSSVVDISEQSTDNETNGNLTNITIGTFGCVNVTNIVNADYKLGNDNCTLRFEDLDNLVGTPESITDNGDLSIGNVMGGNSLKFRDREHTNISQRPYLNITYSDQPTFKHIYFKNAHLILKDKHLILN